MVGGSARDKIFDAIARGLYRVGIRPNHLTLAQVPIYGLMVYEGFRGNLVLFGVYQIVIMVLDGMDGTLARRMGIASRSGAILDAVFDLAGIVLVVIVAAHIHPDYAFWLYLTLATNLALYGQNYLLDEKAVSYIRGPVVLGMYLELRWPGIFWFGIVIPLVTSVLILVIRQTVRPWEERREEPPPGPPPYRPGFSVGRPPRQ